VVGGKSGLKEVRCQSGDYSGYSNVQVQKTLTVKGLAKAPKKIKVEKDGEEKKIKEQVGSRERK